MHLDEETLFNEALSLVNPIERQAYLDRMCATDSLKARVLLLLDSYSTSESLDAMPDQVDSLLGEEFSELPVDSRFGRYQILELLGEGGMGEVYLAEDLEHCGAVKVALKVIKPGLDSRQVLARFQLEQEALQRLDHPGIARFIDSGETESGRAYFVMELCQGLPITQYCDRERLSIADRVRLLIEVCRAVTHAHAHGIIHRDIKPENILVSIRDGVPQVKIIDFGVAKALYEYDFHSKPVTRVLQFIGTPIYMSPEQMRWSSDVDERTDVYSLGGLLCELLTGSPPSAYRLDSMQARSPLEILLCEDMELPSCLVARLSIDELKIASAQRSVQPNRLKEAIRGDLDWITIKAIEFDRQRRYSSVAALTDDLHRYISQRPTLAKPPTFYERWQKFGNRNREKIVGVLTCLFFIVAVAGISWAMIAHQRSQSWQARARAEREAAELDSTHQQFVNDVRSAGENIHVGDWKSALALLDKWLQPDSRYRDHFALNYVRGLATESALSLQGHRHDLLDMDLSPDECLLASCDRGGEVVIWDAKRGSELTRLQPTEQEITRVRFSPDGRLLATAGQDRVVRLFDTANWSFQSELTGHQRTINGLDWSPDGQWLATGARDGEVRIWNVEKLECQRTLPRHEEPVRCLRWSPNGKWLATSDGGNGVHIWSTETWDQIRFVQTHGEGVLSIAFSSDCRFLALGGYVGALAILETDHFQEVQRTSLRHQIGSLKFGSRLELFVGGLASELSLFQYSESSKLWVPARNERVFESKASIRTIALSVTDNRIYAIACEDHAIRILSQSDFVGCDTTKPLPIPVGLPAESKLVLETDENGLNAALRNTDTNNIEWTVPFEILRDCLPLYSARRDWVIMGCVVKHKHNICVFRRSDGKLIAQFSFPIHGLSLSRDSKYLVGGGRTGQVRIWDLDTLNFIDLPYGGSEFEAVARFSPNEDLLVVGPGGTRKLTCLRSGTWNPIREVDTSSNWGTFRFSKSNNSLIVGETNKISVWDADLKTRRWFSAFDGSERHDKLFELTLTNDESTIVGYSGQTVIRFWDVKTRSELFAQTIPRGTAGWLHFANPNTLHVDASSGWYVLSGKPMVVAEESRESRTRQRRAWPAKGSSQTE